MKSGFIAGLLSFVALFAVLLVLPSVGLAQSPPNITALSFTPASINTSAAAATVTLNYTASSASGGIFYVEAAFQDPSATFLQRASKTYNAPASPISDSLAISFPAFSPAGTWQLAYVFVADAGGNTLILNTASIAGAGFATNLQVTSAVDNTPPGLSSFSLTPGAINTSAASANVVVGFTATDNLAGANSFQVSFVSPSGSQTQSASVSFPAALTVTSSATVTFPRFSEAGTWNVGSVTVTDAAANTLILGAADLLAGGFPSTLTVTSASDTTPPALTNFTFAPTAIDVTSAAATVTLTYSITDDLSGATGIQVQFLSPSGTIVPAAATFAANTSVTNGTATATFPRQISDFGTLTWIVNSVFLTDAVGNTRTYANSDLVSAGFPTQLSVTNTNTVTKPPVITFTTNPSSPNGRGWFTSVPVTLTWSVTDAPGNNPSGIASTTGCGPQTVGTETAGANFQCSATNAAGLTASTGVTIRVDTRPPTVTSTITPAPNAAGWNNTVPVTANFNFFDNISGIDFDQTVCDPATVSTETAGATFTCLAVDGAGVSVSVPVTIRIDVTPPAAIATASPAPNGAGWNSTNVTVTFTGTDALSGIASCTAPATLSTEGTGLSASGTCIDVAGNVSAVATASGIKIDKTPPVIVPTVSPAPNAAGWNHTSPVTVTWSVTEPSPGSSVTSTTGCTSSTVTADTTGTTFTCSATNIAGLTNTVSVTVKLATTPPVIVPTVTPAPNAAGWNNSNVTVSWSVTDPSSGIASSTGCGTTTISTETTGTVLTCSATSVAGLSSSASVTIKLDKTAPVTTLTTSPGTLPPGFPLATANATAVVKNTSGTTLGTITVACYDTIGLVVNLNATDGGSGVSSITYAATGAQTITSTTVTGASAHQSITANGLTTLTFGAKDVAGNTEATKSESILAGRGDDNLAYACAANTPTFTIPTHGSLVASGTVVIGGQSYPFSKTITF